MRNPIFHTLVLVAVLVGLSLPLAAQTSLLDPTPESFDQASQDLAGQLGTALTTARSDSDVILVAIGNFTLDGDIVNLGKLWGINLKNFLITQNSQRFRILDEPGNHEFIIQGDMMNIGTTIRIYTRLIRATDNTALFSRQIDLGNNQFVGALLTSATSSSGSVVRDQYEANDSYQTARVLNLTANGLSINASFHVEGDEDWYRIVMPQGNQTLRIATTGSSDTILQLADANSTILASDDDSNGNLNSLIQLALAPGTYLVKVSNFSGSTGSYALDFEFVQAPDGDALEPNDTQSMARRISLSAEGNVVQANFHTTSDIDWYRITVPQSNRPLRLFTEGDSDTVMALYDASGNAIDEDDDSGSGGNALIEQLLNPGDYLVMVRSYYSTLADYVLNLQFIEPATPDSFEPNDSFQAAHRLGIIMAGSTFSANFHIGGDSDWYRFTVPQGNLTFGIYTVSTMDTVLELFDSNNGQLSGDDDSGSDYNARILQTLTAGDYVLHVRTYDGTAGDYSLNFESVTAPQVDAYEPNNSREQASRLSGSEGGSTFSANFSATNDIDWYRVTVPQGGRNLAVSTEGDADTVMELSDSQGNVLANDDDSGDGYNSMIQLTLTAGDYLVAIRNYDNSTAEYTLRVAFTTGQLGDGYEPNDMRESAASLTLAADGGLYPASFHSSGDFDWYRITLSQAGLTVSISTEGSTDTMIELYDANYGLIIDDDDSGEELNALVQQTLSAGQYLFSVRNYASAAGDYTIRIQYVQPARPDDYEADNTMSEAKPISLSSTGQQRTFHSADDQDWVRLAVTQAGNYSITARGISDTALDTYLELYDSRSSLVGSDDDGGFGLDSNLQLYLNPGTYYIKVYQLGSRIVGAGTYSLVANRQ